MNLLSSAAALRGAAACWADVKSVETAADLLHAAVLAYVQATIDEDKFLEVVAKVGLWANMEAARRG